MTVLFVVATILLFLTIDWFVQRRAHRMVTVPRGANHKAWNARVPEGVFFAPSHTWMNLFPSGKVRLGVDDFVSQLFINPSVVLLKSPGDRVVRGEPLFRLRENGQVLTIRSPIDGTVLARNEELEKNPGLLKDLLFSDGWAYTIKPDRVSEFRELLLGEESRSWMQREFSRLRELLTGASLKGEPVLLQDGGLPTPGSIRSFSPELIQQFEEQFLSVT